MSKPKILIFDIETSPLEVYAWSMGEQYIGLEQIIKDWSIIAWSAKWFGDPPSKIMYKDNRNVKNVRDDKAIVKELRDLIDQADALLTQNGVAFDIKKVNARCKLNDIKPYASVNTIKHIDTKKIAAKRFGFTSNKLLYLTEMLCTKYKKLTHKKFPGMELWKQCLANNQEAWEEMRRYNIHDVLSLEELYTELQPWDNSFDPNIYTDDEKLVCMCGSNKFAKNGHAYLSTGKYQRYTCKSCGAERRGRVNLLSDEKKVALKNGVN